MIQRLLVILVYSVLMPGLGSRASAAFFSSHVDAGSQTFASARTNESNKCSWLWSFLNPWGTCPSGYLNSNQPCQSVLEIIGDAGGVSNLAQTSSEEHGEAGRYTLLDCGRLFLRDVFELTGLSNHSSTSSTSSSASSSGCALQAGLPVRMDILCFKTVARLVAEGNFLDVRDYVLSLFRPPRLA
jgi:hypothetical protein